MPKQHLTSIDVSFVIPSRSNLKYLKWTYESIRKNIGNDVWICVADDASTDGTDAWCADTKNNDPYFKWIRNAGPKRLGHCVLYDRIITQLVTTDIFVIAHADMWWVPNSIENMLKYITPSTVVSATRIEPDNMGHPSQPIKHLIDMGTEPDTFNEKVVLEYANDVMNKHSGETFNGIFAPWMCYKKTFLDIGGHDQDNFSPQSAEDSDLFNRFKLNGIKFIQPKDTLVAHLTCRGNRRNELEGAPNIHTNNPDWEKQNIISRRNFARKWHQHTLHDEYMNPIILDVYNLGFIIKNCYTLEAISLLEPWCDNLYVHGMKSWKSYIESEQPKTKYNLSERVIGYKDLDYSKNDIYVEFDWNLFQRNINYYMSFIENDLSRIISDSGEVGDMEFDIFKLKINKIQPLQNNLIHNKNNIIHVTT